MEEEELERALNDVEILCAAYPDETEITTRTKGDDVAKFPILVSLRFSVSAVCELQLNAGYPHATNVTISTYRCSPAEKAVMEAILTVLRRTAQECLEDQVEGCLACAAAAINAWQDHAIDTQKQQEQQEAQVQSSLLTDSNNGDNEPAIFHWYTGQPYTIQKSTFVGHVCRIERETDVSKAMGQLMDGNSKLHRASHNMLAYRLIEDETLKSDNDEDGEGGAGARMSSLLEMRKETGVLVVVSRWFGGIHLGPKRFAIIANMARQALEEFHQLPSSTS